MIGEKETKKFAEDHKIKGWYEVSALTGENIENVFQNLGVALLREFESQNVSEVKKEMIRNSINLSHNTANKKSFKESGKSCKC